jgi:DNA repair exonuclease SbcCD ATPase subunit
MRILCFADAHDSGARHDVLLECQAQMLAAGPFDLCLFAGDMWKQPQVGDTNLGTGTLIKNWQQFFDSLNCPSRLIAGQHDLIAGQVYSALAPFADDYVDVVDKSYRLHLDGLDVLCLPWLYPQDLLTPEQMQGNREEVGMAFRAAIQQTLTELRMKWSNRPGVTRIVLAHIQVAGAGLPSGLALDPGDREFAVTREQLLELGADYYCLGDIHKPQSLDPSNPNLGGYIGTLAEQDFGEGAAIGVPDLHDREGCGGHYVVIDTEAKTFTRVSTNAPRYYTVSNDSWVETVEGTVDANANVRIRDYALSVSLEAPPNLSFQQIPAARESRVSSEAVNCDKSEHELLAQYAIAKGIDSIDDAWEMLADIYGALPPATNGKLGALDSIERIGLKNIGPHGLTALSLPLELIGIAGHNGAGKTFLIEAVIACFYGEWPSRPGFYEQIGGDGDNASIGVIFISGGKQYYAERKLKGGKNPTQDAYLYGPGDEVVAGPKVREFEAAIEHLVGPKDIVLATIFSSQFSVGDLTELQSRERKDVIGKLVGADRYAPIADKAMELYRVSCANEKAQGVNLETLTAKAEQAATTQTEAEQLGFTAAMQADNIAKLEADLEALRIRDAELKAANREGDELRASLKAAEGELEAATQRADGIRDSLSVIDAAKREAARITELLAKDPADGVVEALQATLAEQPKLQSELREAEIACTTLLSTKNALERELEKAHTERLTAQAKAQREYDAAFMFAARVDDRKLGCVVAEPPCLLMADAVKAKASLPSLKETLAYAITAALAPDAREPELTHINAEHEVAAVKAADLRDDYDLRDFPEVHKRLERAQAELRTAQAHRETLAGLTARVEGEATLVEQLGAANGEESRAAYVVGERKRALAAIAAPDKAVAEIAEARSIAEADLKRTREKREETMKALGAANERLAACQQAADEVVSLTDTIARIQDDVKAAALLAEAFGRDGIPQLLIDAAIPQIQRILDDILEGLDFSVTFKTLRDTKAGNAKETLDIIVTQDGHDREIASFSGGERKMVKLVVRLALADFQAQREGSRLRTLFVDECFDALDEANRERMIAVLQRIKLHFNQVLVVTHSAALISMFPARIELTKVGGITQVVTA